MPNFNIVTTVPIGGTVANAFAGSAFEFMSAPSRVIIAQTTLAAAAIAEEVTATIQFGPEIQLEEGAVHGEALAGRGPLLPDDIVVDDVAAAGDRLVDRLTNTGAGTATVRTKVRIIPLA